MIDYLFYGATMTQKPGPGPRKISKKEYQEQIKAMIVIGIYLSSLAAFIFFLFLIKFEGFEDPLTLSIVMGILLIGMMVLYWSRRELSGKTMSKREDVVFFLGLLIVFTLLLTPLIYKPIFGQFGYLICFSGAFLIVLGISAVSLLIARIIGYALE
ncbi:MAG: hypothetical protein JSW00_18060 [Thermoplasmata archaeon]|nr:MAG: hypothetical protein JSW00_18060 [Thermoplasmata archaeon]